MKPLLSMSLGALRRDSYSIMRDNALIPTSDEHKTAKGAARAGKPIWKRDDGSSLFRFSERDRCPDHDESRNHHDDGRRRGHDHSRGDGVDGDDSATRDVARHPRPLSLQD
jgi:hypothetical protein